MTITTKGSGAKDNAVLISDFHNLLTQDNKGSYETYLQRAVNATEVCVGN